jgi:hypothetical protein
MLHLFLKLNIENLKKRDKIKKKINVTTVKNAKYRFVSDYPVFWTEFFPLNIGNFKNINNPKQI